VAQLPRLIKIARSGFLWEKTTKRFTPSMHSDGETAWATTDMRVPASFSYMRAVKWSDGQAVARTWANGMKRTARLMILALGVAMVAAAICYAQEDDGMGPPDGGGGMGQAFGRGNGIRGTVTAAAAGSFTIHTEEGDTYKVLYSANTRLMKDRQPIAAADIHLGDMLMAGGLVDAKAKTVGAVLLYDIDAEEVRKARAGFGKTWVMGKVTAVHDLRITIERASDKQAQIVSVDENTSFRKRREDVTLADVNVGDLISAEGALHADTFLATDLRIMTPQTGGSGTGRRYGADGEPGQPPPGSAAPVQ
jgi:hypothetical protein